MAQTLLNKNLEWAQRWRDRGPVAQRLYPNNPRSGGSAGSGGTTTNSAGGRAQPSSLAAVIYPHLPNAGAEAGRAAPPTLGAKPHE
jgi:hypothetical protein